jgi:hypothetical protein
MCDKQLQKRDGVAFSEQANRNVEKEECMAYY